MSSFEEAVSRGSLHVPGVTRTILSYHDLFGDYIEPAVIWRRLPLARGSAASLLESIEILNRVGQTVRMIYSQSGYPPCPNPLERSLVHGQEYLGIFHANGGKLIYVKKKRR